MRQKFEYWLYIWYMYIKTFKDKLMQCLGYASKIIQGGFPGGSVVKERHVFDPWSGKILHAEEQLSPWTTTTEPVLSSQEPQLPHPRATATEAAQPRARALHHEKPAPAHHNSRKSCAAMKTQHSQNWTNTI